MEIMEGYGVSEMGFQEDSTVCGLKNRLLYTRMELEVVRAKSDEEIRNIKEQTKQLLELIQLTMKQRDEARDQLRILLTNLLPTDNSYPLTSTCHQLESPPPPVIPTEFEPYNPSSSFDPSSVNLVDSAGNIQLPTSQDVSSNFPVAGGLASCDMADMVIEHLAAVKPLPEIGKLVQAVMEAGPLLKTLLVAGPLPQWRNPPPLLPIKRGSPTDGMITTSNLTAGDDGLYSASTSTLFNQTRKRPATLLSSSCVKNFQNNRWKRQKSMVL